MNTVGLRRGLNWAGWAFAAAFLCIALPGCFLQQEDDRRAGAEDFPNTLEPLGKAAASQVAAQSDWNEFDNIPITPTGISEAESSFIEPVAPKQAALLKAAASQAETLLWDLSDTARGLARKVRVKTGPGLLQREEDTLVYRFDSGFSQSEESGNLLLLRKGTLSRSGFIKTWKFVNSDSVGLLDKGVIRLLYSPGSAFRLHVLDVVPDSAANPHDIGGFGFASYGFWRGRGNDTSEAVSIHDLDGDGLLWRGDSGEIRLVHVTYDLPLGPVLKSTRKLKATLLRKGFVLRPHFYQEDRLEKDGKSVTFRLRGRGSDSLFSPGDTVNIDRMVVFDSTSDRISRADAFVVVVSPTPRDDAGNRLLSYAAAWEWRNGVLASSRFTFKADAPASPLELRAQGNVQMTVTFADGNTGEVDGRFVADSIKVKYRETRKGITRKFQITWDKIGNLIEKAIAVD